MGQHLLDAHPVCAGQGWRRAVGLKEIPNVKVPVLGDVAPGRDAVRVNVKHRVANPPQLVATQAGFLLHFAFGRGQGRRITFLAMPARLQPTRQLLVPDEKRERMGWVDDEGGRGDVALERVPAEGFRLGRHKRGDCSQVAGFSLVGGRVGLKRLM